MCWEITKNAVFAAVLLISSFTFANSESSKKYLVEGIQLSPGANPRLMMSELDKDENPVYDNFLDAVAEQCFDNKEEGKAKLIVPRGAATTSEIINFLATKIPDKDLKELEPYTVKVEQGWRINKKTGLPKDGVKRKDILDINKVGSRGQILVTFEANNSEKQYRFMVEVANQAEVDGRKRWTFSDITAIDTSGPILQVHNGDAELARLGVMVRGVEVGRIIVENLNGWPVDIVAIVAGFHFDEQGLQENFFGAVVGFRLEYKLRTGRVRWRFTFSEGIGYRQAATILEQEDASKKRKYQDLDFVPQTRISNYLAGTIGVSVYDLTGIGFFRNSWFELKWHHWSTAGGFIPWAEAAPVGNNVDASSNYYGFGFTTDFGGNTGDQNKIECLDAFDKLNSRFREHRISDIKFEYLDDSTSRRHQDDFRSYLPKIKDFLQREKELIGSKLTKNLAERFLISQGLIHKEYKQLGYLNSDLRLLVEEVNEGSVNIIFQIIEGDQYKISQIDLSDDLKSFESSHWRAGDFVDTTYETIERIRSNAHKHLYEQKGRNVCHKVSIESDLDHDNLEIKIAVHAKEVPFEDIRFSWPLGTKSKPDFVENYMNWNLKELAADGLNDYLPEFKWYSDEEYKLKKEIDKLKDRISRDSARSREISQLESELEKLKAQKAVAYEQKEKTLICVDRDMTLLTYAIDRKPEQMAQDLFDNIHIPYAQK